jgi:hypothetical protein
MRCRQNLGRGLDVAILPEVAVTVEASRKSRLRAVPLEGEFGDLAKKARERGCYMVAPTSLQGSWRREIPDHVIAVSERLPRRLLR